MKKFLAAIILIFAPLASAFAALAIVQGPVTTNSTQATSTSFTQTTAFAAPVTAGHTVLVLVAAASGAYPTTITITDNLGNTYTLPVAKFDYAPSGTSLLVGMIGSASNTPQTISVTAGNATSGTIAIGTTIYEISGGAGTTDYANSQSIASTTSVSVPYTTASANELAFAIASGQNGSAMTQTNGWTQDTFYGFLGEAMIHSPTITGTGSQTITWTTAAAQTTGVLLVSLPPSGGSSCTHNGITSAGALATPNGTTGSYVGKTGAFVTPNCSSTNYWQPAAGNFGLN